MLFFFAFNAFAQNLDIRVLKVEFKYEETDNSLTTGRGTFDSDTKDYKLDPRVSRGSNEYWESHIKFADDYFYKASGGKTKIEASYFPKNGYYKLDSNIINFNRTSRKKGENMETFDSARAADYARFVDKVLELAKNDPSCQPVDNSECPFAPSVFSKRVILIAHAGHSRLVDGGTKGYRFADTPGDFIDAHIDSTWCDETECFWRGFEVKPAGEFSNADSVFSVIVSSESASQDGLNWGINGTIVSQIGRELGLPYSYDVVKGFSRLGYFDGMDFAGSNAGNGFFPTLPSAWMRLEKGWAQAKEIRPSHDGKKDTVYICAAAYDFCDSPQIVKVPINSNEYILLENRQRTHNTDGKINVKLDKGVPLQIDVDSLSSYFLEDGKHKDITGVIESIDAPDAALPASGIAVWHINDWYVRELIPYGALNAWNGDTFRDHQFGISLLEASKVLAFGKEFKNASGESVFYFGSGSDLIPHKRFNTQKTYEVSSIEPSGYANTKSTFGGYSGIKITALKPESGTEERTMNAFTGDSVITWRALKIPVVIERVGEYARLVQKDEWPVEPTEEDFANSKSPELARILADIDGDGSADSVFLGNNRLHAVDSNGVPLKNFPVILSNGEPFTDFGSKPLALDIDGDGSAEILVPVNNGLILAATSKGKLMSKEFPLAAGTFAYEDSTSAKFPMLLYKHKSGDSIFLFAKHRDSVSAFYLPLAKELEQKQISQSQTKDEISEFFIFPNPIRAGRAAIRFRTLAPASEATLDIFDITGMRVFSRKFSSVNHGSNQIEGLDFSKLGSDVYSARLSVKFASGKKATKWVRIAVIM